MNGLQTSQLEDVARQRMADATRAARSYRPAEPQPPKRPSRRRPWRVRWHFPSREGIAGI